LLSLDELGTREIQQNDPFKTQVTWRMASRSGANFQEKFA
jgi:hypothetical protein